MAVVNANNLVIGLATTESTTSLYDPIAHAQNASLSFSNALIDTTTKSSNSWMEKISGQRSFTLSSDGLVDYAAATGMTDVVGGGGAGTISNIALAGTNVFFQFRIGMVGYRGNGFISAFEQSGGTDDAPTFSVTIEGNGELTYDSDLTSNS